VADHAQRWRAYASRLSALARRAERAPSSLVVGGLALVVLATFVVARPAPESATSPATAVADRDEVDAGATVVHDATAPALDGLRASDPGADPSERPPLVPELDDDPQELAPFVAGETTDLAEGEVVPADVIVRDADVDLDALADPLAGATHAAPAAGVTATTPGSDGERELRVLGVDGGAIRPLTPEVTAAADGVWQRFSEGDVLVSHELADELDLELGGSLELRVDGTSVPVRIGAFAANGAPSIADVLVPFAVAADLGVPAPNTLVVSAGGDPEALGDALADATGGDVEVRRQLAAPVAEERTTTSTPSGRIEPFSYTSLADGRITIHGDWVARNITRVQLPGMAATSCHRVMIPQLLAAVDELIAAGVYDHLDPSQFAGCFVARHIDWNPSRPLSMHAWGLAIDFNTRENPLGATPQMDPRVVEVFERWGFEWGGRWSRPDGMHFELARIVPTD
jgi:hypothetical protein